MSHRDDTNEFGPWAELGVRLVIGLIAGALMMFVWPWWAALTTAIAIPALWWVVDNLGEDIVVFLRNKIGR